MNPSEKIGRQLELKRPLSGASSKMVSQQPLAIQLNIKVNFDNSSDLNLSINGKEISTNSKDFQEFKKELIGIIAKGLNPSKPFAIAKQIETCCRDIEKAEITKKTEVSTFEYIKQMIIRFLMELLTIVPSKQQKTHQSFDQIQLRKNQVISQGNGGIYQPKNIRVKPLRPQKTAVSFQSSSKSFLSPLKQFQLHEITKEGIQGVRVKEVGIHKGLEVHTFGGKQYDVDFYGGDGFEVSSPRLARSGQKMIGNGKLSSDQNKEIVTEYFNLAQKVEDNNGSTLLPMRLKDDQQHNCHTLLDKALKNAVPEVGEKVSSYLPFTRNFDGCYK